MTELQVFVKDYLDTPTRFTNGKHEFCFSMTSEEIVLYSFVKGSCEVVDMVTWVNTRLNKELLLGAFKQLTSE